MILSTKNARMIAKQLSDLSSAVKEYRTGVAESAKPAPITFDMVRAWDLRYGTCYVRELEMDVDFATDGSGYCMQFMGDMCLYGLDEAVKLLEKRYRGRGCWFAGEESLKKTVKRIKQRVKPLAAKKRK